MASQDFSKKCFLFQKLIIYFSFANDGLKFEIHADVSDAMSYFLTDGVLVVMKRYMWSSFLDPSFYH